MALILGDSQYSEPHRVPLLQLFAHSEYAEGQLSACPGRICVIMRTPGRVSAFQPPSVGWWPFATTLFGGEHQVRAWMRARDGSPEVERLVCSLEKPITRVKWNFPGDLEECQ